MSGNRRNYERNSDTSEDEDSGVGEAFAWGAAAVAAVVGLGAVAYSAYRSYVRTLSTNEIRFSQNNIRNKFVDGKSVHLTILKIAKGELRVSDIKKIEVVKKNGEFVSKDNRRLYVFRVLNLMGMLDEIEVEFIEKERTPTTTNAGCHVFVRGRDSKTYQHCRTHSGYHAGLPEWWDNRRKCVVLSRLNEEEREAIKEEECIVM